VASCETNTRASSSVGTLATIPNYTPHDLRHRRLTIWHRAGVPARELAERDGHSKQSMTLDVYSHVMPVAEVEKERLRAVLVCTGATCGGKMASNPPIAQTAYLREGSTPTPPQANPYERRCA